jgi:hypothetical protein
MTDELEALRQNIKDYGFEKVFLTFPGIYRAFVISNKDPEKRGRITIACPVVGHDEKVGVGAWVDSALDLTGDRMGWFNPPLVGSLVWVNFDNGDPSRPKNYFGGWFTKSDGSSPVPSEFGYASDDTPQKRGFRSRAGHALIFNDEPGKETVRLLWHQIADGDPAKTDPQKVAKDIASGDLISVISLEKDGSIQLRNSDGAMIALDVTNKGIVLQDAKGNLYTMNKDGVTLIDNTSGGGSIVALNGKGDVNVIASKNINLTAPNVNLKAGGVFLGDNANFSGVNWEPLQIWLSTHTHTSAAPGSPTSPPAVPPPANIKSTAVKLK